MEQRPQRPNFLFIMTDQHRFEVLGCHGHEHVKTPNIDRLAAGGVDFRRAYCQGAICMPSRETCFTGQYFHTHGIMANNPRVHVDHLVTLPRLLQQRGYQTAAIGKAHCGPCDEMGFDHARLCAGTSVGEVNHYYQYLGDQGLADDRGKDLSDDDIGGHWNKAEGGGRDRAYKAYDAYVSSIPYAHSSEAWTGDECLKFLGQRDADKPFFLWASFERPHAPTSVPPDNPFPYDPDAITLPPYDERFYNKPDAKRPGCENMWNVFTTGEKTLRQAMANYFSLVSMIDDQIGRLIQYLTDQGLLEDTVVIFTADHGDFCGEYGQFGKNLSTYDVLHRVPLIWYWKGHTDREVIHELVELTDIMPTVLDLAGVECPRSVQGASLAPVLEGSALRCGRPWDGKEAVFFETPFIKTVRTKTHKLSYCRKGPRSWGMLFDLDADPLELNNLYGRPTCDHVQRDLQRRLLDWMIATDQPLSHGAGYCESIPDGWRWFTEDT